MQHKIKSKRSKNNWKVRTKSQKNYRNLRKNSKKKIKNKSKRIEFKLEILISYLKKMEIEAFIIGNKFLI